MTRTYGLRRRGGLPGRVSRSIRRGGSAAPRWAPHPPVGKLTLGTEHWELRRAGGADGVVTLRANGKLRGAVAGRLGASPRRVRIRRLFGGGLS